MEEIKQVKFKEISDLSKEVWLTSYNLIQNAGNEESLELYATGKKLLDHWMSESLHQRRQEVIGPGMSNVDSETWKTVYQILHQEETTCPIIDKKSIEYLAKLIPAKPEASIEVTVKVSN